MPFLDDWTFPLHKPIILMLICFRMGALYPHLGSAFNLHFVQKKKISESTMCVMDKYQSVPFSNLIIAGNGLRF